MKSMLLFRLALPCFLLLLLPLTRAEPSAQLDLAPPFDLHQAVTSDAEVSLVKTDSAQALRLTTGHTNPWPGVTFKAPNGAWDLSGFGHIEMTVKNSGNHRAVIHCRVDNPGADGTKNCITGRADLAPGQTASFTVPLTRSASSQLDGQLFGLRGYPHAPGGNHTVDPSNITQLVIFVNQPQAPHQFDILNLRAGGSYTPPTAWVTDADPYFPLIDAFGQYKHKDWPGKVHSLAELQQRGEQEAKELHDDTGPPDRCAFGGWASGPKLKATGFFRTEKHQGKWWLVDPDGHLFWSHGIDCVRMLDNTAVEERMHWFEDFPGKQPDFKEFISRGYALKGHYAGRRPECFSFAGANLKRKYGSNWQAAYPNVIHQRLRSWGLNTIANWSDSRIFLMRRTPYTDNIGSRGARMIAGSEGYWGKFPDVYDPSFTEAARRGMAGKEGKSAKDPWCIGFFSDNEMAWGNETSLALAALRSPSDQAAKQSFLADLKAKYSDISQLNQAWETQYASWEARLESRDIPDAGRARPDLVAFYTKTAETYFRIVREAIKELAPTQLYLGCRFAWVNDYAAKAAAQYCDVVSYNLYRRSVAGFQYPGGDKPLIIGEFHFGALDRGMFHTGLVPVENQAARAQAFTDYVTGALKHPQFVGAHWFQYQSEPTTGRVLDEENYQIGFVDIADTPYAETIQASRRIGDSIYTIRSHP